MKKISIITISAISILGLTIQSCQQEASSSEIEAKVAEMYQAKKLELENSLATACDSAVDAQYHYYKDSMDKLDAAHQKALLEKARRDLAAHKRKAKLAAQKKKAVVSKPKETVNQADKTLNDRFSGKSEEIQNKKADDALNDRFSGKSEEVQNKKADDILNDRFK